MAVGGYSSWVCPSQLPSTRIQGPPHPLWAWARSPRNFPKQGLPLSPSPSLEPPRKLRSAGGGFLMLGPRGIRGC